MNILRDIDAGKRNQPIALNTLLFPDGKSNISGNIKIKNIPNKKNRPGHFRRYSLSIGASAYPANTLAIAIATKNKTRM